VEGKRRENSHPNPPLISSLIAILLYECY